MRVPVNRVVLTKELYGVPIGPEDAHNRPHVIRIITQCFVCGFCSFQPLVQKLGTEMFVEHVSLFLVRVYILDSENCTAFNVVKVEETLAFFGSMKIYNVLKY